MIDGLQGQAPTGMGDGRVPAFCGFEEVVGDKQHFPGSSVVSHALPTGRLKSPQARVLGATHWPVVASGLWRLAVSAVASQWERTGKPFSPLLGETYGLIR